MGLDTGNTNILPDAPNGTPDPARPEVTQPFTHTPAAHDLASGIAAPSTPTVPVAGHVADASKLYTSAHPELNGDGSEKVDRQSGSPSSLAKSATVNEVKNADGEIIPPTTSKGNPNFFAGLWSAVKKFGIKVWTGLTAAFTSDTAHQIVLSAIAVAKSELGKIALPVVRDLMNAELSGEDKLKKAFADIRAAVSTTDLHGIGDSIINTTIELLIQGLKSGAI